MNKRLSVSPLAQFYAFVGLPASYYIRSYALSADFFTIDTAKERELIREVLSHPSNSTVFKHFAPEKGQKGFKNSVVNNAKENQQRHLWQR